MSDLTLLSVPVPADRDRIYGQDLGRGSKRPYSEHQAGSHNEEKAAMKNDLGLTVKDGNLLREVNWFALHTIPRQENFAATNVRALGVESFLPKQIERRWLQPEPA